MTTDTKQREYLHSLDQLLGDNHHVPDQEKRLISASLEALTEKGYMDTTVDDIVACARASKSTFYKYFRNKEAVLIRTLHLLVDVLINKVEEAIRSHPPTTKRTYHAIRTYIETCFMHREVTKLLMVDTVGVAPSLETTRLMFHRYFFNIFHREISEAVRKKNLSNCDPWVLSYAMVGAVQEVIIQSIILETPPAPRHLAEVLEGMMSRSLRPEG
ncbi:TetR family transcriptional regulator [Melghirimyces profundicolus]|uniref:TetR family transcriptional regulator n=1 Tax=Melghirimyces profundicolus TaxID=1242148 RepID=A0A2T6BX94_9BACL|nr:TetR/AcrR family transcriptional regulator [Melghirimyces profundicolus]PTX60695.1 TetR family transcriptional regulator [Melghirimyces profundicolus]